MADELEQLMQILQRGVKDGTVTPEFSEAWTSVLHSVYHAGAQAGYEEAKREAGLWTSF